MKEIGELQLPDDIRYTDDHEWARMEDQSVRIGISDFAQDQLGDIVFVELPKVGVHFVTGEAFGTVESVKAVSELFMPVAGTVTAVNLELEDAPELVNREPYTGGWMIVLNPDDISQYNQLKDKKAYLDHLKG